MDTITVCQVVSTLAMGAIWYNGRKSFKLAEQIKKNEELQEKESQEFRQQISDLYQAITIATLLSRLNTDFRERTRVYNEFKELYTGSGDDAFNNHDRDVCRNNNFCCS